MSYGFSSACFYIHFIELLLYSIKQKVTIMDESIYNIIPKQYVPPPKQPLYKSKYPHNIPPTGSSFCHHTTSKPIGHNLSGEFQRGLQAHTQFAQTKTFGQLKGDRKSNPKQFLKSKTGTMGNQQLPVPKNFSYECDHKKAPVPCVHEKPVQGLKSGKNFIISNAIQNILSVPKQAPEPVDWTQKKDYGQTPTYLNRIKENIDNEYKMIRNLHEEHEIHKDSLSEEQINALREGLKKKWDDINKQYQRKTHVRLVDTVGLKRRKEAYQKQLGEIEADIKKLNKNYVFVE